MNMKILKFLGLIFLSVFIASCDENEIEYNTTSLDRDVAEFQLHYFVPLTSSSENYIYKVEVNDELYANNTALLSTYSAIPGGDVGRFYTVTSGSVNFKLYKGVDETLVYNQNVTLKSGKQNVFVYDFDEAPIVFDNGYPYESNITEDTDSACYVKFYNFLFETGDEPTGLSLQYQYIVDPDTKEWVNIGEPVAFGETTGWQSVKVKKEVFNSSGKAKIYYKIKVVDANGNITGDLQLLNSNGNIVDYSDYWNGYIGRRYHHVLSGVRSENPVAKVRQFTGL
jgi:hypothetical protein